MKSYISILLLCFPLWGNAQVCGKGRYILEVHGKEGLLTQELYFAFYPLPLKALPELYGADSLTQLDHFQSRWLEGTIISSEEAQWIIAHCSENDHNELTQALEKTHELREGKIEKAVFTTDTEEGRTRAYLLCIFSAQKEIWIVGNFFDGCDRSMALFWYDPSELVRLDRP